MKTMLTAAVLILAANNAQANGFSPWSNSGIAPASIETTGANVEAAGFAPWRSQGVTIEVDDVKYRAGVVESPRKLAVFRPWS